MRFLFQPIYFTKSYRGCGSDCTNQCGARCSNLGACFCPFK